MGRLQSFLLLQLAVINGQLRKRHNKNKKYIYIYMLYMLPYIYSIFDVKLLSGPSLGFLNVIIWAKLKGIIWAKVISGLYL